MLLKQPRFCRRETILLKFKVKELEKFKNVNKLKFCFNIFNHFNDKIADDKT